MAGPLRAWFDEWNRRLARASTTVSYRNLKRVLRHSQDLATEVKLDASKAPGRPRVGGDPPPRLHGLLHPGDQAGRGVELASEQRRLFHTNVRISRDAAIRWFSA